MQTSLPHQPPGPDFHNIPLHTPTYYDREKVGMNDPFTRFPIQHLLPPPPPSKINFPPIRATSVMNKSGSIYIRFFFDSYSSELMYHITCFRNQPGIMRKLAGEIGYIAITGFAVGETVVTGVISLFTDNPSIHRQFYSSGFCIKWAAVDSILNTFMPFLVPDEQSARKYARSGSPFYIAKEGTPNEC